jgi:hypothetical protein
MTARTYARLAAVIFTIIALLQLSRGIMGWEVTFMGTPVPVWPNWVAFVVAGALAWLGFAAARR